MAVSLSPILVQPLTALKVSVKSACNKRKCRRDGERYCVCVYTYITCIHVYISTYLHIYILFYC